MNSSCIRHRGPSNSDKQNANFSSAVTMSTEMSRGGITREISPAARSRNGSSVQADRVAMSAPARCCSRAFQVQAGGRSRACFFPKYLHCRQRKNCASRAQFQLSFKWQRLHFWDSSSEKCSALISSQMCCFQGYWVLFTFTFRPGCFMRRCRLFRSSAGNKPHKDFLTFPCKYWLFLASL